MPSSPLDNSFGKSKAWEEPCCSAALHLGTDWSSCSPVSVTIQHAYQHLCFQGTVTHRTRALYVLLLASAALLFLDHTFFLTVNMTWRALPCAVDSPCLQLGWGSINLTLIILLYLALLLLQTELRTLKLTMLNRLLTGPAREAQTAAGLATLTSLHALHIHFAELRPSLLTAVACLTRLTSLTLNVHKPSMVYYNPISGPELQTMNAQLATTPLDWAVLAPLTSLQV